MPATPSEEATVVWLVPDGMGVRNYLYTGVLNHVQRPVHLLHDIPQAVLEQTAALNSAKAFTHSRYNPVTESRLTDLLRRTLQFALLHRNARIARNPTTSANWLFWQNVHGRRKLFFRLMDALGQWVARKEKRYQQWETLLFNRMRRTAYARQMQQQLQALQPALLLCTHQRSVEAGYIMTVARDMGIPTATVIFSWDNLPKNRINFWCDHYLVWSQHMRWELQRYYPQLHDQQIHITGTPQFDNYYTTDGLWSRQAFLQQMGIEEDRPVICFSGNEPSFPNDPFHLDDLLRHIARGQWDVQPAVVVRPSPVDHTQRLQQVAHQYPGLAYISQPQWQLMGDAGWDRYYPTPNDSVLLLNLVHHSCCVVNYGSTMGIDFAHGNKPALYIHYDHPDCAQFDVKLGMTQEHFKSMEGMQAVAMVNHPDEWVPLIKAAIAQPERLAPDRLRWKQKITDNLHPAAQLVGQCINKLCARDH